MGVVQIAHGREDNSVLIVNDAPDQLTLMGGLLRKAGYSVLTAEDGLEAFDLANFSISPAESEIFNKAVGLNPANRKAKSPEGLEHLSMNDAEMKKFGYIADFDYISKQIDGWNKRFESEIIPLLK